MNDTYSGDEVGVGDTVLHGQNSEFNLNLIENGGSIGELVGTALREAHGQVEFRKVGLNRKGVLYDVCQILPCSFRTFCDKARDVLLCEFNAIIDEDFGNFESPLKQSVLQFVNNRDNMTPDQIQVVFQCWTNAIPVNALAKNFKLVEDKFETSNPRTAKYLSERDVCLSSDAPEDLVKATTSRLKGVMNIDFTREQAEAIVLASQVDTYQPLLIIGPPGCGKTTTLAGMVYESTRSFFNTASFDNRISVSAPTNVAVINGIERCLFMIGYSAIVHFCAPEWMKRCEHFPWFPYVNAEAYYHLWAEDYPNSPYADLLCVRKQLAKKKISPVLRKRLGRTLIKKERLARAICGGSAHTMFSTSALVSRIDGRNRKLIKEENGAEPWVDSLASLCKLDSEYDRFKRMGNLPTGSPFVLIGDPHQLKGRVASDNSAGTSLMEIIAGGTKDENCQKTIFLRDSKRIPIQAVDFLNISYHGRLTGSKESVFSDPLLVALVGEEVQPPGAPPYELFSLNEAMAAVDLAEHLLTWFYGKDICLLCGYRDQVTLIDSLIRKRGLTDMKLKIGTVHNFQGREFKVVIVSLAAKGRKSRFFSTEFANVAYSRMLELCVMIAAPNFFTKADDFLVKKFFNLQPHFEVYGVDGGLSDKSKELLFPSIPKLCDDTRPAEKLEWTLPPGVKSPRDTLIYKNVAKALEDCGRINFLTKNAEANLIDNDVFDVEVGSSRFSSGGLDEDIGDGQIDFEPKLEHRKYSVYLNDIFILNSSFSDLTDDGLRDRRCCVWVERRSGQLFVQTIPGIQGTLLNKNHLRDSSHEGKPEVDSDYFEFSIGISIEVVRELSNSEIVRALDAMETRGWTNGVWSVGFEGHSAFLQADHQVGNPQSEGRDQEINADSRNYGVWISDVCFQKHSEESSCIWINRQTGRYMLRRYSDYNFPWIYEIDKQYIRPNMPIFDQYDPPYTLHVSVTYAEVRGRSLSDIVKYLDKREYSGWETPCTLHSSLRAPEFNKNISRENDDIDPACQATVIEGKFQINCESMIWYNTDRLTQFLRQTRSNSFRFLADSDPYATHIFFNETNLTNEQEVHKAVKVDLQNKFGSRFHWDLNNTVSRRPGGLAQGTPAGSQTELLEIEGYEGCQRICVTRTTTGRMTWNCYFPAESIANPDDRIAKFDRSFEKHLRERIADFDGEIFVGGDINIDKNALTKLDRVAPGVNHARLAWINSLMKELNFVEISCPRATHTCTWREANILLKTYIDRVWVRPCRHGPFLFCSLSVIPYIHHPSKIDHFPIHLQIGYDGAVALRSILTKEHLDGNIQSLQALPKLQKIEARDHMILSEKHLCHKVLDDPVLVPSMGRESFELGDIRNFDFAFNGLCPGHLVETKIGSISTSTASFDIIAGPLLTAIPVDTAVVVNVGGIDYVGFSENELREKCIVFMVDVSGTATQSSKNIFSTIRSLINILSDPSVSGRKIHIHCLHGCDRTGVFIYFFTFILIIQLQGSGAHQFGRWSYEYVVQRCQKLRPFFTRKMKFLEKTLVEQVSHSVLQILIKIADSACTDAQHYNIGITHDFDKRKTTLLQDPYFRSPGSDKDCCIGQHIGPRFSQEDCVAKFSFQSGFGGLFEAMLYIGIADGHGPEPATMDRIARRANVLVPTLFQGILLDTIREHINDPEIGIDNLSKRINVLAEKALRTSIIRVDEYIRGQTYGLANGTTLSCSIIIRPPQSDSVGYPGWIISSSVGDSPIWIMTDPGVNKNATHKPRWLKENLDLKKPKAKPLWHRNPLHTIENFQEYLVKNGMESSFEFRIENGRIFVGPSENISMNLTQSIGDNNYKPPLRCEPETSSCSFLTRYFILIASDGLDIQVVENILETVFGKKSTASSIGHLLWQNHQSLDVESHDNWTFISSSWKGPSFHETAVCHLTGRFVETNRFIDDSDEFIRGKCDRSSIFDPSDSAETSGSEVSFGELLDLSGFEKKPEKEKEKIAKILRVKIYDQPALCMVNDDVKTPIEDNGAGTIAHTSLWQVPSAAQRFIESAYEKEIQKMSHGRIVGFGRNINPVKDLPNLAKFNYEKCEVSRALGSGGFGYVVRAKIPELGEKVFALKRALKESDREILHEASIGSKLSHENICSPIAWSHFKVKGGKLRFSLVFNLAVADWQFVLERGLKDQDGNRVYRIDSEFALDFLEGVSYMRSKNVLHLDLKPSNALIFTDGAGINTLKITDWGSALIFQPTRAGSTTMNVRDDALICTTFFAPAELTDPDFTEILQDHRGKQFRTKKVSMNWDIFPTGLSILMGLSGVRPEVKRERRVNPKNNKIEMIRGVKIPWNIEKLHGKRWVHAIRKMTSHKPEERPDPQTVLQALRKSSNHADRMILGKRCPNVDNEEFFQINLDDVLIEDSFDKAITLPVETRLQNYVPWKTVSLLTPFIAALALELPVPQHIAKRIGNQSRKTRLAAFHGSCWLSFIDSTRLGKSHAQLAYNLQTARDVIDQTVTKKENIDFFTDFSTFRFWATDPTLVLIGSHENAKVAARTQIICRNEMGNFPYVLYVCYTQHKKDFPSLSAFRSPNNCGNSLESGLAVLAIMAYCDPEALPVTFNHNNGMVKCCQWTITVSKVDQPLLKKYIESLGIDHPVYKVHVIFNKTNPEKPCKCDPEDYTGYITCNLFGKRAVAALTLFETLCTYMWIVLAATRQVSLPALTLDQEDFDNEKQSGFRKGDESKDFEGCPEEELDANPDINGDEVSEDENKEKEEKKNEEASIDESKSSSNAKTLGDVLFKNIPREFATAIKGLHKSWEKRVEGKQQRDVVLGDCIIDPEFLKKNGAETCPSQLYRKCLGKEEDFEKCIGDSVPDRYPLKEEVKDKQAGDAEFLARNKDLLKDEQCNPIKDSRFPPHNERFGCNASVRPKDLDEKAIAAFHALIHEYSAENIWKRYNKECSKMGSSIIPMMDDLAFGSETYKEHVLTFTQVLTSMESLGAMNSLWKTKHAEKEIGSCAWVIASDKPLDSADEKNDNPSGAHRVYMMPSEKFRDILLRIEVIPFTPKRLSSCLGLTIYQAAAWGEWYNEIHAVLRPFTAYTDIDRYWDAITSCPHAIDLCIRLRTGFRKIQIEPIPNAEVLCGKRLLQGACDADNYGTGTLVLSWPRSISEIKNIKDALKYTNKVMFHAVDNRVFPAGLRILQPAEAEILAIRNFFRISDQSIKHLPRFLTSDHCNFSALLHRGIVRASLVALNHWMDEVEHQLVQPNIRLILVPQSLADGINRLLHPNIRLARKPYEIGMATLAKTLLQRAHPCIQPKGWHPTIVAKDKQRDVIEKMYLENLMKEYVAEEIARAKGHPHFKDCRKWEILKPQDFSDDLLDRTADTKQENKILHQKDDDSVDGGIDNNDVVQINCEHSHDCNKPLDHVSLGSNSEDGYISCDNASEASDDSWCSLDYLDNCRNLDDFLIWDKVSSASPTISSPDSFKINKEEAILKKSYTEGVLAHALTLARATSQITCDAEEKGYIPWLPVKDFEKICVEILLGKHGDPANELKALSIKQLQKLHIAGWCLRKSDMIIALKASRYIWSISDLDEAINTCPRCKGNVPKQHKWNWSLFPPGGPVVEIDATVEKRQSPIRFNVHQKNEAVRNVKFRIIAHRNGETSITAADEIPSLEAVSSFMTRCREKKMLIDLILVSDSNEWSSLKPIMNHLQCRVERTGEDCPDSQAIVCLRQQLIHSLWRTNYDDLFSKLNDRECAAILEEMVNALSFRGIQLQFMLPSIQDILREKRSLVDVVLANAAQDRNFRILLDANIMCNATVLDKIDNAIGTIVIWIWTGGKGLNERIYGYMVGRKGHIAYIDAAGFTHYCHISRVAGRSLKISEKIPPTWVLLHRRPLARLRTTEGYHGVMYLPVKVAEKYGFNAVQPHMSSIDNNRIAELTKLMTGTEKKKVSKIIHCAFIENQENRVRLAMKNLPARPERFQPDHVPDAPPIEPGVPFEAAPLADANFSWMQVREHNAGFSITHSIFASQIVDSLLVKEIDGELVPAPYGGIFCGVTPANRPVHMWYSSSDPDRVEVWIGRAWNQAVVKLHQVPVDGKVKDIVNELEVQREPIFQPPKKEPIVKSKVASVSSKSKDPFGDIDKSINILINQDSVTKSAVIIPPDQRVDLPSELPPLFENVNDAVDYYSSINKKFTEEQEALFEKDRADAQVELPIHMEDALNHINRLIPLVAKSEFFKENIAGPDGLSIFNVDYKPEQILSASVGLHSKGNCAEWKISLRSKTERLYVLDTQNSESRLEKDVFDFETTQAENASFCGTELETYVLYDDDSAPDIIDALRALSIVISGVSYYPSLVVPREARRNSQIFNTRLFNWTTKARMTFSRAVPLQEMEVEFKNGHLHLSDTSNISKTVVCSRDGCSQISHLFRGTDDPPAVGIEQDPKLSASTSLDKQAKLGFVSSFNLTKSFPKAFRTCHRSNSYRQFEKSVSHWGQWVSKNIPKLRRVPRGKCIVRTHNCCEIFLPSIGRRVNVLLDSGARCGPKLSMPKRNPTSTFEFEDWISMNSKYLWVQLDDKIHSASSCIGDELAQELLEKGFVPRTVRGLHVVATASCKIVDENPRCFDLEIMLPNGESMMVCFYWFPTWQAGPRKIMLIIGVHDLEEMGFSFSNCGRGFVMQKLSNIFVPSYIRFGSNSEPLACNNIDVEDEIYSFFSQNECRFIGNQLKPEKMDPPSRFVENPFPLGPRGPRIIIRAFSCIAPVEPGCLVQLHLPARLAVIHTVTTLDGRFPCIVPVPPSLILRFLIETAEFQRGKALPEFRINISIIARNASEKAWQRWADDRELHDSINATPHGIGPQKSKNPVETFKTNPREDKKVPKANPKAKAKAKAKVKVVAAPERVVNDKGDSRFKKFLDSGTKDFEQPETLFPVARWKVSEAQKEKDGDIPILDRLQAKWIEDFDTKLTGEDMANAIESRLIDSTDWDRVKQAGKDEGFLTCQVKCHHQMLSKTTRPQWHEKSTTLQAMTVDPMGTEIINFTKARPKNLPMPKLSGYARRRVTYLAERRVLMNILRRYDHRQGGVIYQVSWLSPQYRKGDPMGRLSANYRWVNNWVNHISLPPMNIQNTIWSILKKSAMFFCELDQAQAFESLTFDKDVRPFTANASHDSWYDTMRGSLGLSTTPACYLQRTFPIYTLIRTPFRASQDYWKDFIERVWNPFFKGCIDEDLELVPGDLFNPKHEASSSLPHDEDN